MIRMVTKRMFFDRRAVTGEGAAFLEMIMPDVPVPGGTSSSTSTARPKVSAGGHRR